MIREATVSALDGLVGFRQPIDPSMPTLNAANLKADSGLVFQDASGFVTIENIVETYNYPTSDETQLNTVISDLRASATRDILNTIFNDKSVGLESNTLFPYEEDFKSEQVLTDDLYFIELVPTKNKRLAISIDAIYVSFNEAATFKIYLYNSQSIAPIDEIEVTTVAYEAVKVPVNWVLDDLGTYRIGYKKSEVSTALPLERDYELSSIYIGSCFSSIDFKSANFLVNGRLDLDNENGLEDGYGLNFDYSVYTDWHAQIVKNKYRFSRAIQLQMALTLADRVFSSTRSNIKQRLSKDALQQIAYLVGNEESGTGLKGQFRNELTSIKSFFFPKMTLKERTL
jgi:hypothetical protein